MQPSHLHDDPHLTAFWKQMQYLNERKGNSAVDAHPNKKSKVSLGRGFASSEAARKALDWLHNFTRNALRGKGLKYVVMPCCCRRLFYCWLQSPRVDSPSVGACGDTSHFVERNKRTCHKVGKDTVWAEGATKQDRNLEQVESMDPNQEETSGTRLAKRSRAATR